MAPHCLHSFVRVSAAHLFEGLLNHIHVPSFEVQVLPLFRIGVVRGVLRVLRLGSGRGRSHFLDIPQRRSADKVAVDVRLPRHRVAVPG